MDELPGFEHLHHEAVFLDVKTCRMMIYIFVPSKIQTQRFGTFTEVKTNPPFSNKVLGWLPRKATFHLNTKNVMFKTGTLATGARLIARLSNRV